VVDSRQDEQAAPIGHLVTHQVERSALVRA
jgi:hypothetical protein